MLSEIKHYPVNWVDGMKISKKNFIELENFVNDFLRDSIAQRTNEYNFGVLPSAKEIKAHEVFIHVDSQLVISVKLTHCRAITEGGHRIEIIGDTPLATRISFGQIAEVYGLQNSKEYELYVTLSLNPLIKVPFGEALVEEVPPRYPYTKPQYRLSVIPRELLHTSEYSSAHLIVGKLLYKNNDLRPIENYIPPCATVRALPTLYEQYNYFESLATNLENCCMKIIQKIKLKPEKKSHLSENIRDLMDRLLFTIANEVTGYRLMLADEPPLKMINFFAKLAKVFRAYVNSLTSYDKEELLTYFAMWAEVQPLVIEEGMDGLIFVKYNHNEIGESLGRAQFIWQLMYTLLNKLTQLEYIGERRGKQVFVIENPVHQEKKPIEPIKSKFNPLD